MRLPPQLGMHLVITLSRKVVLNIELLELCQLVRGQFCSPSMSLPDNHAPFASSGSLDGSGLGSPDTP